MKIFRLQEDCDLSYDSQYWYIFNHASSKLYLIKRTNYCNKIFEKLDAGKLEVTDKIKSCLAQLIEDKIVDEVNIEVYRQFSENFSERQKLYLIYLKKCNESISYKEYANSLKNSHITIVGCGAVGSYLSVLLAATDIGELTLIDGDIVEESNLIRQIFYSENEIGEMKVEVLRKKILDINRKVKVNIEKRFVDSSNVSCIIPKCDLIVQTADKPKIAIDLMVEQFSNENNIPSIYTHRDTVGPLYIPRKTIAYSAFLEKINRDTKGGFFEYIRTIKPYGFSKYPAIAHGPLKIVDVLFDEVLSFITKYKEPKTINNIMKITGIEYEKIKA